MLQFLSLFLVAGATGLMNENASIPATMRKVHTTGLIGCKAPFKCVELETVQTPTPSDGEALIRIHSTSVNPSDLDEISGGLCRNGCGEDLSGVVVACPGCTRLQVGEEVWHHATLGVIIILLFGSVASLQTIV